MPRCERQAIGSLSRGQLAHGSRQHELRYSRRESSTRVGHHAGLHWMHFGGGYQGDECSVAFRFNAFQCIDIISSIEVY